MITNSKTLVTAVVMLLGAGCVTVDPEGQCLKYRNAPQVTEECTRLTPQGSQMCVETVRWKPVCVRSTGNVD